MDGLANYIKNERKDRKLTQWMMARRILSLEGLDPDECIYLVPAMVQKLSRWERGISKPGYADIWVLTKVLGCSYEDLFKFH